MIQREKISEVCEYRGPFPRKSLLYERSPFKFNTKLLFRFQNVSRRFRSGEKIS